MHIQLETRDTNSIKSYDDTQIQINATIFNSSLIVSKQEIISDLKINAIQELDQNFINLVLPLNPEIIIVGHSSLGHYVPTPIAAQLSQLKIGIECMSIGAACRTFNILLAEDRAVIAAFIFV